MRRRHNRHRTRWILTGAIAIAAFCLGARADRQAYFACWLAAWWTCAGAVLGSQANLWLHDLTGGAWGAALRPIWRRATAAMPMLLTLMLPLIGAVWTFYPWSQTGWTPDVRYPDFKMTWLSPAFVTVRLLVYAVLWQSLVVLSARSEGAATRRKGASAAGLIIYGITISLASTDLVLSLMPQWYTSGFGLIVIAMQMKLGFALGVVGACWSSAHRANQMAQTVSISQHDFHPADGRDWGNLLLMFVLMWAYVAFVQFMIIWAENLPNEIVWYVPRVQTDWRWLAAVLVLAGFFAPLLLLLFRAIKQDRVLLGLLSAALCLLGWLESIWISLPSVSGLTWHALWMAPLALTGMAALLWTVQRQEPQP